MWRDPVQGQGRRETLKLEFISIQSLSPSSIEMGADKWLLIITVREDVWIWASQIFNIWFSFCVTWLWASLVKSRCVQSDRKELNWTELKSQFNWTEISVQFSSVLSLWTRLYTTRYGGVDRQSRMLYHNACFLSLLILLTFIFHKVVQRRSYGVVDV